MPPDNEMLLNEYLEAAEPWIALAVMVVVPLMEEGDEFHVDHEGAPTGMGS